MNVRIAVEFGSGSAYAISKAMNCSTSSWKWTFFLELEAGKLEFEVKIDVSMLDCWTSVRARLRDEEDGVVKGVNDIMVSV